MSTNECFIVVIVFSRASWRAMIILRRLYRREAVFLITDRVVTRVVVLSAASSFLQMMSALASITIVVMDYWREGTASSFNRVMRSTVCV